MLDRKHLVWMHQRGMAFGSDDSALAPGSYDSTIAMDSYEFAQDLHVPRLALCFRFCCGSAQDLCVPRLALGFRFCYGSPAGEDCDDPMAQLFEDFGSCHNSPVVVGPDLAELTA
eukprot:gnl/MRDRNA2_/MRDRNA2_159297_c0_seq1.p2 gnl/MRDRNA2_/MRDRNA2_159297_c0~~gnl/MRDRNA2_/MRDRNA2_159297_c0_seq1.p2  ORF type:complete len:115 (+),score=12.62 gnl/MRDRNA2_/MRDRNA2_159297_c0_seq1:27-371(+)